MYGDVIVLLDRKNPINPLKLPGIVWSYSSAQSNNARYLPRRLQWAKYCETPRFRLLHKSEQNTVTREEKIRQMFLLAFTDPNSTLATHLQRRGMSCESAVMLLSGVRNSSLILEGNSDFSQSDSVTRSRLFCEPGRELFQLPR
jgi:hypothetical protein